MEFALVIQPSEAIDLVPNWPNDVWLVLLRDQEACHWEAVLREDLAAIIGFLPVWPPLSGFPTVELNADVEVSLIRYISATPELAAAAADRIASRGVRSHSTFMSPDEIDWET